MERTYPILPVQIHTTHLHVSSSLWRTVATFSDQNLCSFGVSLYNDWRWLKGFYLRWISPSKNLLFTDLGWPFASSPPRLKPSKINLLSVTDHSRSSQNLTTDLLPGDISAWLRNQIWRHLCLNLKTSVSNAPTPPSPTKNQFDFTFKFLSNQIHMW